ncbi:MAG: hypothetical protein WKF92_09315 [Pyrinomonadaceae bacterium]
MPQRTLSFTPSPVPGASQGASRIDEVFRVEDESLVCEIPIDGKMKNRAAVKARIRIILIAGTCSSLDLWGWATFR